MMIVIARPSVTLRYCCHADSVTAAASKIITRIINLEFSSTEPHQLDYSPIKGWKTTPNVGWNRHNRKLAILYL